MGVNWRRRGAGGIVTEFSGYFLGSGLPVMRASKPRQSCRSSIAHGMFRSRDEILLAVYSVPLDDGEGRGGWLSRAGRTEVGFESGAEGHDCIGVRERRRVSLG